MQNRKPFDILGFFDNLKIGSDAELDTSDNPLISRWTGCERGRNRFTGRSGSDLARISGVPEPDFGPVPASPTRFGPQVDTRPSGTGGLGSAEKPSQSAHVVRYVRHRDGGLGAGQPDGPDRQPHPGLLVGEDMLDLRPVLRLAPVGLRGPRGHRTAARLLAVDAAIQPVLLQPLLVLRRAVSRVPPHVAAGVAVVDQPFAKPLAVVRGGVRHDLAADDPVLLVDADVGLVAEDRNGDVDQLPAVRLGLRLLVLDRPARVRVLLRRLGRRVRPDIARRSSLLDRRLLLPGHALARRGDQRRIHDLARPRDEARLRDDLGSSP